RIPTLRRRLERSSVLELTAFSLASMPFTVLAARRFKPDLIHVFFGLPSGPGALAARLALGVPYVLSLCGSGVPRPELAHLAPYYRLSAPALKLVWRRAAAVVAVSEELRQATLAVSPGLRIDVIPRGVRTNVYSPLPRLQPDAAPLRLLTVGRLQPFKGVQHLLSALALLDGVPDWTLEVIGDGPYRQTLEQQAARLGLRSRVTFTGWIEGPRLIHHYQRADIYVSPSLVEGMSNTLLEAMACQLPVLCTQVGGVRGLVEDGRNGLIVAPGDDNALQSRLAELLTDARLRRSLATEARRTVHERFEYERTNHRYIELYQRVAALPVQVDPPNAVASAA